MPNTIRFYRGSGKPTGLQAGEPGFDTSTCRLWIGCGTGPSMPLTRMDPFSGLFEAPEAKAYPLTILDRDVTKIVLKAVTASGTCDIRLRQGAITLLGSGVLSCSSTLATQTTTLGTSLSKDDRLFLVVSNLSTPVDLSFTIWFDPD